MGSASNSPHKVEWIAWRGAHLQMGGKPRGGSVHCNRPRLVAIATSTSNSPGIQQPLDISSLTERMEAVCTPHVAAPDATQRPDEYLAGDTHHAKEGGYHSPDTGQLSRHSTSACSAVNNSRRQQPIAQYTHTY